MKSKLAWNTDTGLEGQADMKTSMNLVSGKQRRASMCFVLRTEYPSSAAKLFLPNVLDPPTHGNMHPSDLGLLESHHSGAMEPTGIRKGRTRLMQCRK